MEILTQPTEFILEEFGVDVTLIYGDFVDGRVVFYSLEPLKGYRKNGDTYSKSFAVDDEVVQSNRHRVTGYGASNFPRLTRRSTEILGVPEDGEIELFGVERSYAHVASSALQVAVCPEKFEWEMKNNPFCFSYPRDIILAHEGAHVAAHPHNEIFPQFFGLVANSVKDMYGKEEAVDEAIAILAELGYIRRFHPQLETLYIELRSADRDLIYDNKGLAPLMIPLVRLASSPSFSVHAFHKLGVSARPC